MWNKIGNYIRLRRDLFYSILIWLGAVLLFFSPSVFSHKVIAPLDCLECVFRPFADKPIENVHNQFVVDGVSQYLPYKYSMKSSLEQDGYIGWNPYTHNGCAIPENTMTSPGDLFNFLYVFLPFWTAWDLGIILQFFIAGCGMIILLREYKIPIWGCVLAAISFAFYSQFVLWIFHKWVAAMIWGPFLAWALIRYKHHILNVPAIIFMALAWRTGHLQSCVFAFMLVASMWLAEIWKKDGKWPNWHFVSRITASYLLTGIVGALLSLDVFVDTLARLDGCKDMGFNWGISNVFTFGAALFPNTLGLPQTLDAGKAIGVGLFDIKYGGGLVLILALIGLFNARAPRYAKSLFVVSLLAVCTPLNTYIYNRSTVMMAIGMSWLAVWQLYDLTKWSINEKYWKRITYILVSILVCWLIASILILIFKGDLSEMAKNELYERSFPNAGVQKFGRIAWQEARVEKFLSQIVVWDWRNIIFVITTFVGVCFCAKIKPQNRKNILWIAGVVSLTYGELVLFSSSWVSYSNRPEGPYLYNAPSWMPEFKKHVKDGSVTIVNVSRDQDFLCNNALSGYDVRLTDGYETFQPEYLTPLHPDRFAPDDYAQAAVSHIVSESKWKKRDFPGWKLVMTTEDFELYENPCYFGRYYVDDNKPVCENWRTCNRISLSIPKEARKLIVLESYHRGWSAYLGNERLEIVPTERGAMEIVLPSSEHAYDVLLEFRMPWYKLYYAIMGMTLLSLCFVGFKRVAKKRK